MSLEPQDLPILAALRREDVESTLAGIKRFTGLGYWLGKNNIYRSAVTDQIAADMAATGQASSPRQLAQYVAASSILHCIDGWSYLGKSISAALRGDPHRARHLAYYAELRAAMSLLATYGIGVFKRRHFVIDSANSVRVLRTKEGTHDFAWHALEHWSQLPQSTPLFGQIIVPGGRSLEDWLHPIGGSSVVAPQAQDWFLKWGMDLHFAEGDRDARNESSYRPDGIPSTWTLDAAETLGLMSQIWSALEPSAPSHFEQIDRHILRLAAESVFNGQNASTVRRAPAQFRVFVKRILADQSFPDAVAINWEKFLVREVATENLSLIEYSNISPTRNDKTHLSVPCRATMLLRVATGSTSNLFRAAGFTPQALAFWWEELGKSRGLWDTPLALEDLPDLWGDLDQCLRDLRAFEGRHPSADRSFFKLGRQLADNLVGLGSVERVAVWSLANV